ncbi:thioredoxin F-type, chloroplastic [Amborella trichopoda]|uniref:Thioredoxin domain-containing protein n=1 Tax=Amborella trichopoda TaxID=13333 RepID=W1PZS4_AMBTC|nr:thioredoxin F-type, chloroplastic [Amborella trichopoda]ERN13664.1 hypothetical protein AMTR_s00049p00119540 [Amborella trichopoda]|eukprot:XP_006852197.1 thioredoxin F-type, chloroplastic [Amborella trichopoda]
MASHILSSSLGPSQMASFLSGYPQAFLADGLNKYRLNSCKFRVSRPYGEVSLREKANRISVKGSLEMAEPVVGQVTAVNKDTFWPIVNAAGNKVVVLDMYTQWCGPCKVIAPKFQELSEKYSDVIFLKLDCNQENKPLAKELGIRVVPTFKILKENKVVKEVTGAKLDDLVAAIDTVRSSS